MGAVGELGEDRDAPLRLQHADGGLHPGDVVGGHARICPQRAPMCQSSLARSGAMPVPERPVLVAPDSFKGTFNAAQVAGAIGRGIERAGLMPPDLCPVADGGEGTLDALLPQLGGELIAREVRARSAPPSAPASAWSRTAGRRSSRWRWPAASAWMPRTSATPGTPSTYGTGELIAAAAQAGAAVILVAVGGSATTDGGAGAIEAIEAAGGIGKAQDRRAVRRPHALRGRAQGLRPAEGRRRGDGHAAREARWTSWRRRFRRTRAACR